MSTAGLENILIYRLSRCFYSHPVPLNRRRTASRPEDSFQSDDLPGLARRRAPVSTNETEWGSEEGGRIRRRRRRSHSAIPDEEEDEEDSRCVPAMPMTPAGTCPPPHHAPPRSPSFVADPESFPYPDPLPPDWDPPSRFLDRLLVLSRLEADTKRQEERRSNVTSASTSGRRSAVPRRRPGDRATSAGPRRTVPEPRQRPKTAMVPAPSPVRPKTATAVSSPPRPRTCPPEASRVASSHLPRGTGRPVPNTAAAGRLTGRRVSPGPGLVCSALLKLDFDNPVVVPARKQEESRRKMEAQTVISLQYIGGGRTAPHPHMMAPMRHGFLGPANRGDVEVVPMRTRPLLRTVTPESVWSLQFRQK